jgi:hypothetical protein
MTAIKTSRFSRTISRLREAVSDMNYAQRRLFELQAGPSNEAARQSRGRPQAR